MLYLSELLFIMSTIYNKNRIKEKSLQGGEKARLKYKADCVRTEEVRKNLGVQAKHSGEASWRRCHWIWEGRTQGVEEATGWVVKPVN